MERGEAYTALMPAPHEALSDDLLFDLIPSRLDALVAALDRRIGRQLDEILHHPLFQALERAWRGLWFVVERTDFRENIQVELWSCTREELRDDFQDNLREQSALHRLVYTSVYEHPDGRPYGALVAD